MIDEIKDAISVSSEKSNDIIKDIVKEEDSESLKNLINLFNVNQHKKSIIRANVYGNLLDKITDELNNRISNGAVSFSNKDLLDCINVINSAMTKNSVDAENISIPQIQANTQINVNVSDSQFFDRESKNKIASVVDAIIKNLSVSDELEPDS